MQFVYFVMVICFLVNSAQAKAWGQIGHRVTGAIAQDHLSPEAQAKIGFIISS